RQNIDILHINNGGFPAAFSCYSAVVAGKLCGIKNIVYVVNNIAQDYSSPMRWLDYPLDQFVKYYVFKFITGSKFAGSTLKEILTLPNGKLITIPNGIKPRKVTLEKDIFIQTYQIPKDRIIISVIANLEIRKGHIYLLEAIKILSNEIPNQMPIFVFEGSGPEKKILSNYIAENNLEQFVIMYNYILDIFNLINASDIIILPSIENEDFPNVTIEAMSLGKPVIGTKIAGIPEQIVHNKTGLLVRPKSANELVKAIKMLVCNPLIIEKFSKNSIIRFNQRFLVEISLSKYKDLYWRLLN
ncbi:glycosyltransferase family 4 protein, partial [Candidatus Pacearchaeota archaeon]|nr:glycosyltransferase family 4 protein [Candidatus Pacearchaeota archaeon]